MRGCGCALPGVLRECSVARGRAGIFWRWFRSQFVLGLGIFVVFVRGARKLLCLEKVKGCEQGFGSIVWSCLEVRRKPNLVLNKLMGGRV